MLNFKNICVLGLALFAFKANAATEDMQFNSDVTHTCAITVTKDGKLDPRGNFTRLTTRSGPGLPGRATVVTSGNGFTLSVDSPTAFDTQPVTDTTPEIFRAWHGSNGSTTFGLTRHARALNRGTSNLRIHMDARKTGGDVFEAGSYSATVILRCE